MLYTFALLFAISFALQDAVVMSEAGPSSSPTFKEWFESFDPEKTLPIKDFFRTASNCTGLTNDYHPATNPDECQPDYIICLNNQQYPTKGPCPSGQVYDDSQKKCENIEDAKSPACRNPSIKYPIKCDGTNADTGIFLPTGTCQQEYYICLTLPIAPNNVHAFTFNCTDPKVFNLATKTCVDSSSSASCNAPNRLPLPSPAIICPPGFNKPPTCYEVSKDEEEEKEKEEEEEGETKR